MSIIIGRLGFLGLGIESSPGVAKTPDVYLPFTEVSMRGHHEPIEVTSAKTSRIMDTSSVVGKKWSEGDVKIDLDVMNSGYLWKLALGNEQLATGTPNIHTFYTSVSGNTPKTATLVYGRDTDTEQYVNCAVDELKMSVSDGLAEVTASFMAQFPTAASGAFTPVTTSGTVLSFKDMNVYFGSTLATAEAGTATAINETELTIANNLEMIYRSGTNDVSLIKNKGLRVTGSYTVFFENETDKNAYYNLTKRAMVLKFTGNANEEVKIRIPKFRLSEGEISTGLDDFFVVKAEFVAEDFVDAGCRLVDVQVKNDKGTVY